MIMNRYAIFLFLIIPLLSFSQALSYADIGVLFSGNNHNGSARFTAMGGAFGAVGGDVSALTVNPAGLSIFNQNNITASLNSRNASITSSYYNNQINSENNYFTISNAGIALVYDNLRNRDWSNLVLGFNYRILNDFDNFFLARGNSGFATFNTFPLDVNDPPIEYNNAEEQTFSNSYRGEINEFNFALSAIHKKNLHLGFGINLYELQFNQRALLSEVNNDGNENTLFADFYQEILTSGSGISISTGFIYRVNDNLRIGASYFSPTWFIEVLEDSNITDNDDYFGDTQIEVTNSNLIYDNTLGATPIQTSIYNLRTPGKFTASAAYIFGKSGLVSIDYTHKRYEGIRFSGSDFSLENQFFANDLRNTHAVNLGTEWRFGSYSLRGGYSFEQSPDKLAIDSDNLQRYAVGLGYSFGNTRLDITYSDSNRTGSYDFYPQYNEVNAADLDFNTQNLTASISISF